MKKGYISLLVLAAWVLAACSAPAIDDVTWQCTTSADCGEGWLCSAGVCQQQDADGVNGVFPERLVIGMTGALTTGPDAIGKAAQNGILACFDHHNKRGGVAGRQIELKALDDGGDGAKALENAKSLFENRSAFALLGSTGTDAGAKVAPYMVEKRALLFGSVSGAKELRNSPPDRYVFNFGPGLETELSRLIYYVASNRQPAIAANNIAMFAQGTDSAGALDAHGQAGLDALKKVLSDDYNVAAANVVHATHTRGTLETKPAVKAMLKWIGSGNLDADQNQQISAVVVLQTTYKPAAQFVKELLDEVFKIKRDVSQGADYQLTTEEAAVVKTVRQIFFVATSSVGSQALSQELSAFGQYDIDNRGGRRAYCSGTVISQVVPSIDSSSSGVLEYKDRLAAFDANQRPSFIGLQAYLAAEILVSALKTHGRGLSVEPFIDTLEGLGQLNLGIGTTAQLNKDRHQVSDSIWGTLLGEACAFEAIELGDKGQPPDPTEQCQGGTCIITGTITENMTLTADKKWLLRGTVFIGDETKEVRLQVDPGTLVMGEKATIGTLVIRRGSKLVAVGIKEKPIVFTSDQPKGKRARGDWGGVVINGYAPINGCSQSPCEAFGEGGTGFYGGTNPADNSGWLSYVRIEYAGALFSEENELNGLALQAVGSGTKLDHIQVHMGQDDGIEFFGGTANVKYLLVTGAADDSVDWTMGWRGKAQFVVIQQYDDDGDNGIEADNNSKSRDADPRSKPTIFNITLIGSPQSSKSDHGMLIREGTAAHIHNAIITGFNDFCINIDHEATFKNAWDATGSKLSGELLLSHSILKCDKTFKDEAGDLFKVSDFFTTLNTSNQQADPLLTDPFNLTSPGFAPQKGSPAESGAMQPTDSFFTKVDFIGGVDPADDWTKGWTTSDLN
jgi:hypothetical protein